VTIAIASEKPAAILLIFNLMQSQKQKNPLRSEKLFIGLYAKAIATTFI